LKPKRPDAFFGRFTQSIRDGRSRRGSRGIKHRTLITKSTGGGDDPVRTSSLCRWRRPYKLPYCYQAISLLKPEEELAYAQRLRENGDRAAAYHLVTSHLRLVAKLAMRYRGYGLPIADVISEGNIGLMQAVKRFDPAKGFKLSTYATWWIKATIQDYILRSWSIVQISATSTQKRLFFNLRRLKSRRSQLSRKAICSPTMSRRLHIV